MVDASLGQNLGEVYEAKPWMEGSYDFNIEYPSNSERSVNSPPQGRAELLYRDRTNQELRLFRCPPQEE